jgi:hypothetical protein
MSDTVTYKIANVEGLTLDDSELARWVVKQCDEIYRRPT